AVSGCHLRNIRCVDLIIVTIRIVQDEEAAAWFEDAGNIANVNLRQIATLHHEVGKNVNRERQVKEAIGKRREIAARGLDQIRKFAAAATTSRSLQHAIGDVDAGHEVAHRSETFDETARSTT